jgi:hypothetical protein
LTTDAAWLSIDSTTGVLSGTPPLGSAGPYSVRVTVTDIYDGSDFHDFTLTVEVPPEQVVIIQQGDTWRYSEIDPQPDSNWNQPGFDDIAWLTGPAPFGYGDSTTYGTVLNDNDGCYYFRKTFTLDSNQELVSATLSVASDDYADVYLNGVLVLDDTGADHEFSYWNRVESIPTSAFQTGTNTIAVFVENTASSSDAYMELELVLEVYSSGVPNEPPTITSSDITSALEGVLYTNTYAAPDPENDPLTWSLTTDAVWLSIDPSTGELSGTPPLGSTGSYAVMVTVEDTNGGSDSQEFTLIVSFGITLYPGWNLISIPYIENFENILTVLSEVTGLFDTFRWNDPSASNKPWKSYVETKTFNNHESGLDKTMGLWIHMTISEPITLTFNFRFSFPAQQIHLEKGWNLIGYPLLTNLIRTEGLNNTIFGEHVDKILWYNASSESWEELGENDYFERGRGYYVHAKMDHVWKLEC